MKIVCPSCKATLNQKMNQCPVCQIDLSILMKYVEIPDWYFNQAVFACKNKNWHEAIERLAVVELFNPSDIPALVLLAKVYIELNLLKKAKEKYKKVLRLDINNTEAENGLFWLLSLDK